MRVEPYPFYSAAVAHWHAIRSAPDFGRLAENIRVQPLAHERAAAAEERVKKLEAEMATCPGCFDRRQWAALGTDNEDGSAT